MLRFIKFYLKFYFFFVFQCIRELNAQREFELSLKKCEKKKQQEYKNFILIDVEKYKAEEKRKKEEQLNKRKLYKEQLINQ